MSGVWGEVLCWRPFWQGLRSQASPHYTETVQSFSSNESTWYFLTLFTAVTHHRHHHRHHHPPDTWTHTLDVLGWPRDMFQLWFSRCVVSLGLNVNVNEQISLYHDFSHGLGSLQSEVESWIWSGGFKVGLRLFFGVVPEQHPTNQDTAESGTFWPHFVQTFYKTFSERRWWHENVSTPCSLKWKQLGPCTLLSSFVLYFHVNNRDYENKTWMAL